MKLLVNGDTVSVEAGASLLDLLQQLELTEGRVAVEINQQIVPRSEHAKRQLQADDRVEIVHAIGGG